MIIQTLTTLEKNPNTKTTYINRGTQKELLTSKQYNLTVSSDTQKFFRRLGGSETAERAYTNAGYNVIKLTSVSPDRQIKKVREFKFINFNTYRQQQIFENLFQYMDEQGLFKLKRFKRLLTLKEVLKVTKLKSN